MEKNSMTMGDFMEAVKEHLFDNHPEMADTHEVEAREVMKNNSTLLHGITIREKDERVAPTIYLESFFDEFKNGGTLAEIADRVIEAYEQHKAPKNISVDFFSDFEQAKDRLAMKIVNADKNAKLLSEVPHFKFGDLAAIFQVQVDSSEFGNAVITVRDEHMKMWGVSTDALMENARANMEEKQPVRIQSMIEVLTEMMSYVPAEMTASDNGMMYVMTNETKINGAAAMILTDKLDEFAQDRGTNVFILPSSIHEILLIPDNGTIGIPELEAMVKDVNATQVAPDEVLSDNVYFYDKDARNIYIAATNEPCVLESDGKDFSKPDKDRKAEKPKTADKEKAPEKAGSIKEKLAEGKAKAASAPEMTKEAVSKVKGREIE